MSGKESPACTRRASIFRIVLVFFLLGLVSGGCQPSVNPAPLSTPRVLSLQVTSSLLPLQPLWKACIEEQKNIGLVVTQVPTDAIQPGHSDLALRWGLSTPPDGYAATLGQEELVVVVNPNNPIQRITAADLRAVYSADLTQWPDSAGETIQPWVYPSSEDLQEIFVDTLLQGALPAQRAVFISPDPQAMREAIGENPAAIGFLPRRWLSSQVKEIEVQGLDQAELRRPILALSKAEPQGPIRDWLLCLQERLVE